MGKLIIAAAFAAALLATNAAGVCKLCGRKGTCFEKHGRWYCATLKKGGGPGGPVQMPPPGFGKKGYAPPPAYGRWQGQEGATKKPERWKNPEHGKKPEYGAKPAYGVNPEYGTRPEHGRRPPQWKQPEYGKKPEYGTKPGYGAKPEYGAKPGYGTSPSYGGKPAYGTGKQQNQAGQQTQVKGTSMAPAAIKVDTTPIMMGGPTTHVKKADVDYMFNKAKRESADEPIKSRRQSYDLPLQEQHPAPDRNEKL